MDELGREVELRVVDHIVLRRDLKRVRALDDERRVDRELLRPERVCGGTSRSGCDRSDRRAVYASREAVGILDEQAEAISRNRRLVERERRLPVERLRLADHFVRNVSRNLRAKRTRVDDIAHSDKMERRR